MVDVQTASEQTRRKAPMEGHVIGAIVVVIMVAMITLLSLVVYRFKEQCMNSCNVVSPGCG